MALTRVGGARRPPESISKDPKTEKVLQDIYKRVWTKAQLEALIDERILAAKAAGTIT